MSGKPKGRGGDKGKAGGGKALMDQMGMFSDMSAMDAMIYGDLDEDEDLEAELLALQNDSPKKTASPARAASPGPSGMNAIMGLDRMVAESMKDDIDDEDVSDTEDPDLMAELEGLTEIPSDDSYEPPAKTTPPNAGAHDLTGVLEERLAMYQTAYSTAKAAGDTSKARRVDRGLKTIRELLKKSKSGKPIDEDDIPPAVAATAPKASPSTEPPVPESKPPSVMQRERPTIPQKPQPVTRPSALPDVILPTTGHTGGPATAFDAPSPITPVTPVAPGPVPDTPSGMSPEDAVKFKLLSSRMDNYKAAALKAKKSGDNALARKYMGTSKQFEKVVAALESGQPIDLSGMPPSPPGFSDAVQSSTLSLPAAAPARAPSPSPDLEEAPPLSSADKKKLFDAPEKAGSVNEALVQRMEKYKASAEEAKQAGTGSKARRMTRIVKQYEDAIKAHGYGRPVNFEELPCPPGFPPLPTGGGLDPSPRPSPAGTPGTERVAAPVPHGDPQPGQSAPKHAPPKVAPQGVGRGRHSINRQASTTSRAEQQCSFLQERQLQFKKAAMIAKKNGDIELAKKYLRQAKGFDQMILAAQSGLPVNLAQVPVPPGSKRSDESYEFVQETKEGEEVGDRDETYKRLEQEMINQIRTCTNNTNHFTRLGDVSSANKFENLGANGKKDLNALKNAYKHGDDVPRFHYETKQFSIVQCCPDLGDNDMELQILRGLNFCLPSGYSEKDMDTYVKYELPFPNDEPQKGDTNAVKHSISPEYDQTFKLEVNRKSRSFLRLLKSNKYLKLEVYYKRGMFKSDKLLGTVNIKLAPLENQCEVHESYDLMDGRKSIGGKLEMKIRVRDPFLTKQVEEVKEKWLIIDIVTRRAPSTMASQAAGTAIARKLPAQAAPTETYTSVKVLEYEKQLLQQQVRKYQGKLNKSEIDALQHKGQLLDSKIEETKTFLKSGGTSALRAYADSLERTQNGYIQEAKSLVQKGNRDKAQILMTKKKLAQNEIDAIRSKLG